MSSNPPASLKPSPRRRGRWLRRLALALLILIAGFIAWLYLRGGETVDRPLVALLPSETAVALQVHRLADLLEAYDASPLAQLVATDDEIAALLLRQEEYQEFRTEHAEAELRTHLDLGREFLLRWAGREMTLALIPAAGEPHPGLVVITQADLRFQERLAELVAQLYPGAQLVTSEHRGTPITTWVGSRPRDSLSFCRFGETVAVSLRTDSTAYLQAIVDAVRAEKPPEQPAFPPPTAPGVHAWVNAERLPRFLASLPSERTTAWLASPDGQQAMELAALFEEARLTYTMDAPRVVRLELRARPSALSDAPEAPDWYALAPGSALAAAHFEEPSRWWRMWGSLLFDFQIKIDEDWSPERVQRRLARREWRVRMARWLRDEVLPLLDGPVTGVISDVQPRFGPPAVLAGAVWGTSNPSVLAQQLRRLLHVEDEFLTGIDDEFKPDWLLEPWQPREVEGETFQTWQTSVGLLGWGIRGEKLYLTLDQPGDPVTTRLLRGWSDSLRGQERYQQLTRLWGEAPRIGEVYLNAYSLAELSPLLLLSGEAWGESSREYLEQVRLATHLLRIYPSIGIALQHGQDRLSLTLAISASNEQ